MRLTDHFTIEEFAHTDLQDFKEKNLSEAHSHLGNILKVCDELEKIRKFFGAPVTITSGFRFPELNTAVKGSKTSQHTKGEAADFSVAGHADRKGLEFVFEWCRHNIVYGQLILETPENRTPWIHFGLPRPNRVPTALLWDGKEYRAA